MQRFILILTLVMLLYSPAQAAERGQSFFGIQYALTEIDLDVSGLDEFEPTALVGRFGQGTLTSTVRKCIAEQVYISLIYLLRTESTLLPMIRLSRLTLSNC